MRGCSVPPATTLGKPSRTSRPRRESSCGWLRREEYAAKHRGVSRRRGSRLLSPPCAGSWQLSISVVTGVGGRRGRQPQKGATACGPCSFRGRSCSLMRTARRPSMVPCTDARPSGRDRARARYVHDAHTARIPQLVICEGVSAGILGTSECRLPNQFLQALEELSRSGRGHDCRIHLICRQYHKTSVDIQNSEIQPVVPLSDSTISGR